MKRFETGDHVRFRNGSEIGVVTQTFERHNWAMISGVEQFKVIVKFSGFVTSVTGADAFADLLLVRESTAKGDQMTMKGTE